MYQLTYTSSIKRLEDGAIIPEDMSLSDWANYQDWLKAGNTPIPVTPPTKAEIWEKIKANRELLSDTGGYSVMVGGIPKWFHSDAKSKTQQLSLLMMGAAVVNVPAWKTMDGSKVTMTQALAGQIFAAAVTKDGMLFAVAEMHRAAMEASATPETYDYSGGWPASFVA